MLVWVKPFWYTIHLLNPNLYMPVYVFLFYLLKILNQVCVCVCVCEREREREREREKERERELVTNVMGVYKGFTCSGWQVNLQPHSDQKCL